MLLVRALDRLHRRIQAVQKLMPSLDIARYLFMAIHNAY